MERSRSLAHVRPSFDRLLPFLSPQPKCMLNVGRDWCQDLPVCKQCFASVFIFKGRHLAMWGSVKLSAELRTPLKVESSGEGWDTKRQQSHKAHARFACIIFEHRAVNSERWQSSPSHRQWHLSLEPANTRCGTSIARPQMVKRLLQAHVSICADLKIILLKKHAVGNLDHFNMPGLDQSWMKQNATRSSKTTHRMVPYNS